MAMLVRVFQVKSTQRWFLLPFFCGHFWECAACPRLHKLALLPGGPVENLNSNLRLFNQRPHSLSYPASSYCHGRPYQYHSFHIQELLLWQVGWREDFSGGGHHVCTYSLALDAFPRWFQMLTLAFL